MTSHAQFWPHAAQTPFCLKSKFWRKIKGTSNCCNQKQICSPYSGPQKLSELPKNSKSKISFHKNNLMSLRMLWLSFRLVCRCRDVFREVWSPNWGIQAFTLFSIIFLTRLHNRLSSSSVNTGLQYKRVSYTSFLPEFRFTMKFVFIIFNLIAFQFF